MSDNAGDGKRGLRADPSQQLLLAVQAEYGMRFGNAPVDLGGSSNLNLLLADSSSQWVLRVYRPYVTPGRLHAIQTVRRELAQAGIPVERPVLTQNGQAWVSFNGKLVELERYVAHDAAMNTWASLERGMPMLARIHTVLAGVPSDADGKQPLFANYIPAAASLRRTLRGTQRIKSWQQAKLLDAKFVDQAEALARRVFSAERPLIDRLPKQLVHGDFWDNNVFFRGDQLVLVTDFDFMGERPRIDDLALTLYFACMQFFDDAVSDHQLFQLQKLLNAYDRCAAIPLSSAERAALPLAIARQPLWSIGGWVALLDDEHAAQNHAVDTIKDVNWALRLMDEVDRWQNAFAR